jgi:N-acetylglucosamine kinase-like BadF-type ATPase
MSQNLVVDLGQSGARIKIGEKVTSLNIPKTASATLLETLELIFQQLPKQDFETVYLSLTGLYGAVSGEQVIGELCQKYFNSKHVAVLDDGIAAYIGALGNQSGVVLTLGGGVVAISSNAGKFGHADGKGAIFGDLGGGFWVGQTAMRRAIATLDGRDNATDLVELMRSELQEHEKLESKNGVEAVTLCINATKTVTAGAEAGVVSAIEILNAGADHLAKTVLGVWRKVSTNDAEIPNVCIMGGPTRNQTYVDLIKLSISSLMECNFVTAKSDHLVGALLAAELYPAGVDPLFKWSHL